MPNFIPLPELKHAGDPRLVEGVSNHCDRWCDRCRFQDRCLLRCDERYREALIANGVEPMEAFKRIDDAHRQAFDAFWEALPPHERREREEMLEAAHRPLTSAEERDVERAMQRREQARKSHPLCLSSDEYSDLARHILEVIRPLAEARKDEVVLAALETISWFSFTIHVKTARAIAGLVDRDTERDDEAWLKSDANGTAKLTRLIIAESIEAWRVLMAAGHGTADGVPAAMIARLEKLDAGLAEVFPRAMEFVRAGFDE